MNRTGLKYYLRALGIGIVVTALLMGYSQKGQAQMSDEEILQRAAQLGMTESQGVLSELATPAPDNNSTLQSVAAPTESPAPVPTTEPTSSPTPAPTEGSISMSTEPAEGPVPMSTAEPTEGSVPTSPEHTESPVPAPTEGPTTAPAEPTEGPTSVSADPVESLTSDSTTESTLVPTPDPTAGVVSGTTAETVTLVINRGESSMTVSKSLEELGLVEDYKIFDRYLCDNKRDHSICAGTYEIPIGATDEEITRIICRLK